MKSNRILYELRVNPFRIEIADSQLGNAELNSGQYVIIHLYKEILLGQIIKIINSSYPLPDTKCHIIRLASESDWARKEILNKKTEELKEFFEHLLKRFKLSAKVVLVDLDFNQHKVYCYLTSERKINYLLLHETAVDSLKTRVAIKQIGVRDYARSIGGLGICGRELCCRMFLPTIQSITLTTARRQNIFVEPEKITGVCGKLRCCITFESCPYLREQDTTR